MASGGGFLAFVVAAGAPRALSALGGLSQLAALGLVDERAFATALTAGGLGRDVSYHQAWWALACEVWLRARRQGEVWRE
jgi:hypothetical protein